LIIGLGGVGDGKNLADFTFVDNVVHGHLKAAEMVFMILLDKRSWVSNDWVDFRMWGKCLFYHQ